MRRPWWTGLPGGDELAPTGEEAAAILATLGEPHEEEPGPRILTTASVLNEWMLIEREGDDGCVWTGWPNVDGGLYRAIRPGEVALVAARTGVGKTWAGLGITMHNVERDQNARALVCTLEMPGWQMGERVAAMILNDTQGRLARKAQRGDPIDTLALSAWPAHDRVSWCEDMLSAEGIDAAWLAAGRPGLVVVDYMGLLRWDGSQSARAYERASEKAHALKDFAKRRRVVVLAACQVGRQGGRAGATEPGLDDLRDSGVIEEASDRILMFWRDEEEQPIGAGALWVKLEKNRRGPTGFRTRLQFGAGMRLVESADR